MLDRVKLLRTAETRRGLREPNDKVVSSLPAPWEVLAERLKSEFALPFQGGGTWFAEVFPEKVRILKSASSDVSRPAYLGADGELRYDIMQIKHAAIPQRMSDLDHVLEEVAMLFQGAPDWASPLTMTNVIPQTNPAAVVSAMLAQVFSTNLVDGEYAWNVHIAELETAGMLANLFGWDANKAGAVYTFGGTGCLAYGLKYGLTRVLRNSRSSGVRTDARLLCSDQAHYAVETAADWTGLGTDNVVRVPTDPKTGRIDPVYLEIVLRSCNREGIPVAAIVCTIGTTDSGALESVREVRRLIDRHPNPAGFGKALLYVDAVAGWAWAYFCNYDFELNALGFSRGALSLIKRNSLALSELVDADAVGVDFHKVGWAPCVSSCFVYRNAEEFEGLQLRQQVSYLQERSPYNPMNYTLEVSRSAAGAVSGWATLKYFGLEGMQALLGSLIEKRLHLLELLRHQRDMLCVNEESSGLVTLFRIYPRGVDSRRHFSGELSDPAFQSDLLRHNRLIERVASTLYVWFRQGKSISGRHTPYIGFSGAFRGTTYKQDKAGRDTMVSALKIYPMNMNVTSEGLGWALYCVRLALAEVYSK